MELIIITLIICCTIWNIKTEKIKKECLELEIKKLELQQNINLEK